MQLGEGEGSRDLTVSGVAMAGVVGRQHHTVPCGRATGRCPIRCGCIVGEPHCLSHVPPTAAPKLHMERLV